MAARQDLQVGPAGQRGAHPEDDLPVARRRGIDLPLLETRRRSTTRRRAWIALSHIDDADERRNGALWRAPRNDSAEPRLSGSDRRGRRRRTSRSGRHRNRCRIESDLDRDAGAAYGDRMTIDRPQVPPVDASSSPARRGLAGQGTAVALGAREGRASMRSSRRGCRAGVRLPRRAPRIHRAKKRGRPRGRPLSRDWFSASLALVDEQVVDVQREKSVQPSWPRSKRS